MGLECQWWERWWAEILDYWLRFLTCEEEDWAGRWAALGPLNAHELRYSLVIGCLPNTRLVRKIKEIFSSLWVHGKLAMPSHEADRFKHSLEQLTGLPLQTSYIVL